ncbi:DUF2806 domain-containing protein [Maricaulis sp.]|uniref:DUF2806 domain-containing protein n=1 Tax=Maricaulis sp. TaxID=1486257 RepID=UPI00262D7FE2|nr:DUF2806 domain-containing protein [Maricaulis sp.]
MDKPETSPIDWPAVLALPEPLRRRAAAALARYIGVPWAEEPEASALVIARFADGEAVDSALGIEAKELTEADAAVMGRASARLLSEAMLTQSHREAIAKAAVDQIRLRQGEADETDALIDIDWLLTLGARSQRAADPVMQRVWAAALAAEILHPGSVSVILLSQLNKLGARELGLVNKYAPMVISGEFIPVAKGDMAQLKSLFHLQSLGFVYGAGTTFEQPGELDDKGVFWIAVGEEAMVVRGEPGQQWQLHGVFASETLQQLGRILNIEPGREAIINAAKAFLAMNLKAEVMRAKWSRNGDQVQFEPIEIYHSKPPAGAVVERVG